MDPVLPIAPKRCLIPSLARALRNGPLVNCTPWSETEWRGDRNRPWLRRGGRVRNEPDSVIRLETMGPPPRARFPEPTALKELVRCIVEVAKPERIILFGSAARGQMGPDSDLDVLVVKSAIEHRRRLAQDIYMNLPELGVGVDVIVLTPEDIEAQRTSVGSIIGPALEEGRVIYGA